MIRSYIYNARIKGNPFKLLLIFFIGSFFSCNGQKKEIIKPEEMYTTEKFNIEKFNQSRKTIGKTYNSSEDKYVEVNKMGDRIIDSLSDGTKIIYEVLEYVDTGIIEYNESITPPPPGMFCIYKIYYPNGNLKTKYTKMNIVGGDISFGLEYHYNEKGRLIDKVDNNKLYNDVKINPEVLFDILDKEGIYSKKERQKGILSVQYHYDKSPKNWTFFLTFKKGDTPFWEVIRSYYLHDGNQPYAIVYKVDALTGEITPIYKYMLDRAGAPFELIPLQNNNKISSVYKTYKGKEYNQKEWEELEEKLYEEYSRKNNISTAKNDNQDKNNNGFASRFLLDD